MAFRSTWVLRRSHLGAAKNQWFRTMTALGPALTSKLREAEKFTTAEDAYAHPAFKAESFVLYAEELPRR